MVAGFHSIFPPLSEVEVFTEDSVIPSDEPVDGTSVTSVTESVPVPDAVDEMGKLVTVSVEFSVSVSDPVFVVAVSVSEAVGSEVLVEVDATGGLGEVEVFVFVEVFVDVFVDVFIDVFVDVLVEVEVFVEVEVSGGSGFNVTVSGEGESAMD